MLSSVDIFALNIICTIIAAVMISVLFVLCVILLVQKIRYFKYMNSDISKRDP